MPPNPKPRPAPRAPPATPRAVEYARPPQENFPVCAEETRYDAMLLRPPAIAPQATAPGRESVAAVKKVTAPSQREKAPAPTKRPVMSAAWFSAKWTAVL